MSRARADQERNTRSVTALRASPHALKPLRKNRIIKFSLSLACLLVLASTVAPLHSQTVNGFSHEERDAGLKLYQEGRYSEASAALKRAVKRNKTDADAWYYLGLTHLRQKDFKAAP